MPFLLTYYLTRPAASAETADDAGFPGGSARLVCDAESFDQQHFLDLVDRLLPEEYLLPLKLNPDAGYEILQAFTSVGERLSAAMHAVECGMVMLYAEGARYAATTVVFYRENYFAGAVTVKAGTVVTTSDGDRAFETTADAVFGATDLTVTTSVRAVVADYQHNVRGERVTAGGEVLPGEIDTVASMIQSPDFGDNSIQVRQEADATGGAADWLSRHGDTRGLTQSEGETEDSFRLRMRTLPDTISPAAMRRTAASILDPLGIPWQLLEAFDLSYMTCWDAPSPNSGTPSYQATLPTAAAYNPNLFCWDDLHAVVTPYQNRWLSQDDYAGAFIVVVDRDYTVEDHGFAFDDPGTLYSDFISTKRRGTPAFDVPDPSAVFAAAAFDGTDAKRDSAIASVYLALQQAKAAGVAAIVDFKHTW